MQTGEFEKYVNRNPAELAQLISDHVSAMLAYWDKDLVCRFANDAYVEWFGKTKEEMVGKIRIDQLLGPLFEKNLPYIKEVLLGKKQLFEREIPLPDGSGTRHSLATYIPDIHDGEVAGFFVHVADVTYLKNLEKEIVSAKREILRSVIETEETEKRHLVEMLRENISQRLAGCKIAMDSVRKKEPDLVVNEAIGLQISGILRDINLLCEDLIPSGIELLGLIEALGSYLENLSGQLHKTIDFVYDAGGIENIELQDKYAVFRMIQNLVKAIFDNSDARYIQILLKYNEPCVSIKLQVDAEISLNTHIKEYNAVICRVEYYSGKLTELLSAAESVFNIDFCLTAN